MRHLLLLMAAILIHADSQIQIGQREFPDLKGPYLGQTPPGRTPAVFAPGIVNMGLDTRDIAISKHGNEIYFGVSDGDASTIFVTKREVDWWTEPAIAQFSGKGFLDLEPHITPLGDKFFFRSNRPPDNEQPHDGWFHQNIWMMTQMESGWSEPELVGDPVSSEEKEFFPSVTRANVLYFTRQKKDGTTKVLRSRFENCRYTEPEILPIEVPDKGSLFNTYISPREDFLITCALNIDSTNVDQDYYVSFKKPNDEWSGLIKLGSEINMPGEDANSAYVSPDGKYLFFSSSRKQPRSPAIGSGATLRSIVNSRSEPGHGASAIYWVDAKILEDLRPKREY